MALGKTLERQGDWLFRKRGYLPLLLVPPLIAALVQEGGPGSIVGEKGKQAYLGVCLLIAFVGLWLRCLTVGFVPGSTSGRNTDQQIADSLNTTGAYSLVRHPLYLANVLIYMGVILSVGVWWFTLLSLAVFTLYYERIMLAEESFLKRKFGVEYIDWAERTPAAIPRFGNWRKSAMSFSLRTVLRREYSGFFAIMLAFFVIQHIDEYLNAGRLAFLPIWDLLFVVSLAIYLTLRTLKKKTRFLHEEGR